MTEDHKETTLCTPRSYQWLSSSYGSLTDYYIGMEGEEETLHEIAAFLQPAVEQIECFWGAFVLHIDQLPLNVDEDKASLWTGLAPCSSGRWFGIGPSVTDVRSFEGMLELPKRLGIDEIIEMPGNLRGWQKRCRDGFPHAKTLGIYGSCDGCPLVSFIEALSRKWPTVRFEFRATSDHDVHFDAWEAIGGVLTELHRSVWDYKNGMTIWRVKDGQTCDPPLFVPDNMGGD